MARIVRAERRGPRVVPAQVLDAHEEAARLIAEAKRDAARVLEQARALGRDEANAELATERLRAAAAREARLQELEREALQVALMAAERIVGESIARDPQLGVRMVGELFARVRRATRVSVRVHPDDAPALERARDQLCAGLDAADPVVEIVIDPDVRRGGCVVHSDVGSLDARLEVQLEALSRALER